MQGKIIKGIAGFYYVHDRQSKIYECKARGIFRNRKEKPLVGDDVEFDVLDEEKQLGNISLILERKNELIRPSAANIDQAVIIFAAREPAPNFSLLDHFLITMEQQSCKVSILFSKSDQIEEMEKEQLRNIYRHTEYPIRFVSSRTGEGMEEFRQYLHGKTTVLAGPSGVGKTSLLNAFVTDAEMETGELSRKLQRGKHTTRHSEIFWVEADTYLVDTPGFSALTVENLASTDCREFYPEFLPYWNQCRFRGCLHEKEPGCRIKQAVTEGDISRERYESYLQLLRECREAEQRKYN